MKKLTLIITIIFTSFSVNAQIIEEGGYWEQGYYVDDFGDKTRDTFIQQWADGVFSNSATVDAKSKYKIRAYEKVILIDIYTYDDGIKESFIEASQEILRIKTPSGLKKELKVVLIEDGTIVFMKKSSKEFKALLKEKGEFQVVVRYNGKYSKSSYEFSFFN